MTLTLLAFALGLAAGYVLRGVPPRGERPDTEALRRLERFQDMGRRR
jgi:hypothetical protein